MPDAAYTSDEMMTVAAARMIRNGVTLFVGIGLPSAAANLARLTHAPDTVLIYESGTIGAKPTVLPLSIGDGELSETADAVVSIPEIFPTGCRAAGSGSDSWARRRSTSSPTSTAPSSAITTSPRSGCPDRAARRKSPDSAARC